jgi:GT2 family glycosyltransferase
MLTVFIATRNGTRTLPGVLETFTQLQVPAGGWKLVIIDNGSTDQTRNTVLSFQDRLPLKYLFEGSLGKNIALNSGLAELEGDLAVFSDDDVLPSPDWLVQLRSAADTHTEFAMFGGVVLPRWETDPPEWLQWAPPGPTFTITDPDLAEGPVEAGSLYGPNMAVRAEVFRQGARFDPSIGPQGTNYPMGSETEFVLRMQRQGHKAWHVHQAVVQHCIRDFQMEQSWVLKRAIRFGRGRARLQVETEPYPIGFPFYLVPRVCKRWLRIAMARLSFQERDLFTARWELNCLLGQIMEMRNLTSQRRTGK